MENGPLAGRHIIVTGGGQGIGRAMTLGMVKRGAFVIAVDIVTSAVNAVAEEARILAGKQSVMALTADVSHREGCESVVDRALADVRRCMPS